MSSVIKTEIPKRAVNLMTAIAAAAEARQVSPLRIGAELVRFGRGRQRLSWPDYFLYGVHQPWLTATERAEFLGDEVLRALNDTLGGGGAGLGGMLLDKLLTDQMLTRCGIPVAGVRAVASTAKIASAYEVLRTPAAIEAFLTTTPLPFFGKPAHASRSVGAISIVGREGATLILGNGQRETAAGLAAGIVRLFPDGYLFQNLLQPHPDLARIVGPVIASVRLVTVRLPTDVVPLYAAMKMPGAGQMVDDIVSVVNTMCAIELSTGRIIRGQDACKMGGTPMPANPVTGTVLAGTEMPLWPQTVRLALDTHLLFRRQGILATDIAITPEGPKVIELNSHPLHGFYQKCFTRGFWNPDFAPVLTEALAGFGHRKATRKLAYP